MRTNLHQPEFSDAAIRQFLLGRLRGSNRLSFERALFSDSSLEKRTRLEEIALADDYARHKLRGEDLDAFIERFPFSAARRNQIEVASALSDRWRPAEITRDEARLAMKNPVRKLAFATMIVTVLFATIWMATREPRIVRRLIPHRSRPAVVTTPTPEIAHHAERTSEPATHREDSNVPSSHEAATNKIVLDSTTTVENAPTVMLATVRDENVRVQLLVGQSIPSTYLAEFITSTGEVIYEGEMAIVANVDRINFDIPIAHLAAGDFQIRLTRTSDSKQTIYFLRVK